MSCLGVLTWRAGLALRLAEGWKLRASRDNQTLGSSTVTRDACFMLSSKEGSGIRRGAWKFLIPMFAAGGGAVLGIRLARDAGTVPVRDLGWGIALVSFIVFWWLERRARAGR